MKSMRLDELVLLLWVVKRINRGLVALLQQDGYSNIAEAVGKES
jgi:dihydroorotate dehydrogenase